MRSQIMLKILSLTLIGSAIGLSAWLLSANFPRSRQLVIPAVFDRDQPMLTRLGPDIRIKMENGEALILDDPVYFDLRSLPWFSRLRVTMVYRENSRLLQGIGGQVGAGWQYDVKTPVANQPLADGYRQAIFDFNLAEVYQQKNVRRFAISTKDAGADAGEIDIRKLILTLYW